MANQSLRVIAEGLKPLTTHVLTVGELTVNVADVQVTGKKKGDGQLTTDERGRLDFTIFLNTNDGVAQRSVILTAPFSRAAGDFTF